MIGHKVLRVGEGGRCVCVCVTFHTPYANIHLGVSTRLEQAKTSWINNDTLTTRNRKYKYANVDLLSIISRG